MKNMNEEDFARIGLTTGKIIELYYLFFVQFINFFIFLQILTLNNDDN